MNLRNCARCGKMFNYIGGQPICDLCKKAIEEDFQKVKQYIEDNPTASLRMISEENQVSTKQIQQWILRFSFSVRIAENLLQQEDFVLSVRPVWPILLTAPLQNQNLLFSSLLRRSLKRECASWILKEQRC